MDSVIIIVAVTLFFAAFLQSATGFGMAIVLMAILPLVISVEEASAFTSLGSMIVTVFVITANRAGLSFRDAGPLVLGMCIEFRWASSDSACSTANSSSAFSDSFSLPSPWLSFYRIASNDSPFRKTVEPRSDFSEASSRVPSTSEGRRSSSMLTLAGWAKVTSVAVLQTAFLAGGVIRNSLVAGAGDFTPELLKMIAYSMPTAIFAVWLGKKTLDRMPRDQLKKSSSR